jgi:hypothetical protein
MCGTRVERESTKSYLYGLNQILHKLAGAHMATLRFVIITAFKLTQIPPALNALM